ncbi:MAG: YncE family protein, partial [Pyrinomonadaceae bacterium]
MPDLSISKTHTGNFTQGGSGSYQVTVANTGPGEKIAGSLVTVTDSPPSGLTITGMSGTGWTCNTLP